MLQDLRFRIVGQNASRPAFQEVQRDTKATQTAFGALNGSLAQANRDWMMFGSSAANTTKLTSQQMGLLQFQLQDMAVGLASGQSPFILMIQQGSQIVQMFGPGTGVLGALKSVGAGLLTFVTNPLNLALLGFAAASAAAGALWSAVSDGGSDAEGVLERHAELVKRINEAYGEARTGVEEFARESAAVVQFQFEQHVANLRSQLQDAVEGFLQSVTFTDEFGQSQVLAGFESFSGAIEDLADSAETGEPDVRAFRETLVALARARPGLAGMVSEMLAASDAIDTLSRAAEASRQVGTPDASFNGYVGAAFQVFAEQAAYRKLKSELDGATRTRRQAKTEAEKQAEAVARVVANLEFEAAQLTRTAEQQEIYNALKQAGVDLNSAEGQQIAAAVQGLQALRGEQEKLLESQLAAAEAQQFFGDAIYDSLTAMILYGRDAEDVMKRLALAIGEAALQALLLGQGPLAGLFGTANANGGLGGLLGALLGGFLPSAHGNAFSGGNVIPFARGGVVSRPTVFPMARGMGLMGEAGPEAVMPLTRDSNGRLGVAASGGTGTRISASINVTVSGARGNREIEEMVLVGTGKALDRFRRDVLPRDVKVHTAIGLRQGDIRR